MQSVKLPAVDATEAVLAAEVSVAEGERLSTCSMSQTPRRRQCGCHPRHVDCCCNVAVAQEGLANCTW